MSHSIKIAIAKRNLASALHLTEAELRAQAAGKAGPYKAFIPVEISFDDLAVGELSDLLAQHSKLILTGSLGKGYARHHRALNKYQKGMDVDHPQGKASNDERAEAHKRVFCLADLWNIHHHYRHFTIYHSQCYT